MMTKRSVKMAIYLVFKDFNSDKERFNHFENDFINWILKHRKITKEQFNQIKKFFEVKEVETDNEYIKHKWEINIPHFKHKFYVYDDYCNLLIEPESKEYNMKETKEVLDIKIERQKVFLKVIVDVKIIREHQYSFKTENQVIYKKYIFKINNQGKIYLYEGEQLRYVNDLDAELLDNEEHIKATIKDIVRVIE